MRGEKSGDRRRETGRSESPPRARGKVHPLSLQCLCSGITPACAGKSPAFRERIMAVGDHPRVCGEKGFPGHPPTRKKGSPPRVRGKDLIQRSLIAPCGITPACAGKSQASPRMFLSTGDHPRACGEKTLFIPNHAPYLGSSPRARGKVERLLIFVHADGITPACAGKRRVFGSGEQWSWDHPRVRGEKS